MRYFSNITAIVEFQKPINDSDHFDDEVVKRFYSVYKHLQLSMNWVPDTVCGLARSKLIKKVLMYSVDVFEMLAM